MSQSILLLVSLLLFALISSVWTFNVNATQTYYEAEENQDVLLEWTFPTKADSPDYPTEIYCELLADRGHPIILHLFKGEELKWSQSKQFKERVQYDKDLLKEGRLRLNISRLTTDLSGLCLCTVFTSYGTGTGRSSLNVTAARNMSEPKTPKTSQTPKESRERVGLYCSLGLTGVALLGLCYLLFRQSPPKNQDPINPEPKREDSVIEMEPKQEDSVFEMEPKREDSVIEMEPKREDSVIEMEPKREDSVIEMEPKREDSDSENSLGYETQNTNSSVSLNV